VHNEQCIFDVFYNCHAKLESYLSKLSRDNCQNNSQEAYVEYYKKI